MAVIIPYLAQTILTGALPVFFAPVSYIYFLSTSFYLFGQRLYSGIRIKSVYTKSVVA